MKGTLSVLKGGALRRKSQVAEPTMFPEMELMKMWEIDTEEYAVATGIPLEDVRDRVMPFNQWLTEQGFTIQGQEGVALTPERIIQYQEAIVKGEETLRTGMRDGVILGPNERADLEDSLVFWRRRLEESGVVPGKKAQSVDDQVTGMIVMALDGVKRIGAAWDTYLKLKGQGVSWDDLGAQVKMVRKDTNDAIGLLQSVLSRLFMYE